MVPLIGSICAGSIGVRHLPRTWWKVVTRAVGLLDAEYPDNSGGLDAWCLEAIGIDAEEAYDFLRAGLPDYVTFERWILKKKNGRLPAASVGRFNEIVRSRCHIRPHKIVETYRDIGFDPDVHTCVSALLLNTLQDWHLFHARDLTSDRCDVPAGIAPLVSSLDVGPMDVMQLPRTWYKALLDTRGLMHKDYPACGGGLDRMVLDALGLDRDETVARLREALPTYMDFERWILGRIGEVDRAKVDAFQTFMLNRVHPEPKRRQIHDLTGCDSTLTNGVLLNHLEDWRIAYDVAVAPRR